MDLSSFLEKYYPHLDASTDYMKNYYDDHHLYRKEQNPVSDSSKFDKLYLSGKTMTELNQSPYLQTRRHKNLYVCDTCLDYFFEQLTYNRHREKCRVDSPPGVVVYTHGDLTVYFASGKTHKAYCQRLCLLARLFIESKTLIYDVDPFEFIILTKRSESRNTLVGYFSREKDSSTNNLSCLLVLPIYQGSGYGTLLVELSYSLSRRFGRVGSPEKPLSETGLKTYLGYWTKAVYSAIRMLGARTTLEELSKETGMTINDVVYAIDAMGEIVDNKRIVVRRVPNLERFERIDPASLRLP